MTIDRTRRISVRSPYDRYVVGPTHTAVEADEQIFTAYRVEAAPDHGPMWLKHTVRVDPSEGSTDELVFTVTERYYDPETDEIQTGIGYEVSRPLSGRRTPLSVDELEQELQTWYEAAHAPIDGGRSHGGQPA